MRKWFAFSIMWLLILETGALAENRAYLLEVYDHISKRKFEVSTLFSPDKYIITHGGGNRLTAIIKATWMCYGDTSGHKPACPMPKAKDPIFRKGDLVEVLLEKHMTQGWLGYVELSLYREDLKSNVYGIRFGKKRNLYNRYYEFNLKLIKMATVEVKEEKPKETEGEATEAAPEEGTVPQEQQEAPEEQPAGQ